MRARTAAILGVAVAIGVAALAFARRHGSGEVRAVETTQVVRIVRRDRVGLPAKKSLVRDRIRVRALTAALGVDDHPPGACPPDYAAADFGIVLSGNDVYVRRNVYVFGLPGELEAKDSGTDGGPSVVSVTSAGCRMGPPSDRVVLERELHAAGVLD